MPQNFSQEQIQGLRQTQQMKLTQQQLLAVKLIEMPLEEFEQSIIDEMNVNPALEERHDDDIKDFDSIDAESDNGGYEGDEATDEQLDASNRKEQDEEREKALERMDNEDELPENDNEGYFDAEYKDVINSNQESFLDSLKEQMGELELTPDETIIMEYLIGSLDSDGLLHTDLDSITEYLYCYYNMNAVEKDVEAVLTKLQTFDPAGIGARNLQECLLLQVDRMEEGMMKNYIRTIINECYEDFSKNHWYKIQKELNLGDEQMETIRKTVKRRLNPRPGYALGEAVGVSLNQITPDFIVEINNDDHITFEINDSRLPKLCIANEFEVMLDSYKNIDEKRLNRNEREAKQYLNTCLGNGKMYIEAIKMRQQTLKKTMEAIIKWQKKYFLSGDETELRTMRLEDIASKTGLDISTISRVSREKYVQSQWGIKPLKFFFSLSYVTNDGEEINVEKIKQALKELIDGEDKKKPLSDEALVKLMKEKGFPIARRTIAKYRDQMLIPSTRIRRQ